jgi:predicted MFS family arabinose efflux permease
MTASQPAEPHPPAAPEAPARAPLHRRTVWLFAAVAALSVANLYYNQPLLADIARAFGVEAARAGYLSTLTQVGYALGLLLFVPLADVRERRSLVVTLLLLVSAALAAAAAARSLEWLAVASLAIGATTVVPQIVIPFAAGLAEPRERGRVVGTVVGGLLVGILGGRTVAGLLGAAFGWRVPFAFAAGLMLVLAAVAWRLFPATRPAASLRYGELLRSLGPLVRAQPVLRAAAVTGALAFAAFSAFWTTLAFRLETPPLHYGPRAAGLFGLVGIVGALTAPLIGRVTDRRSPRTTLGAGIAASFLSFAVLLGAGTTLVGLVAGVVLLDAGVQAVGVSNQARIYALPAELHARLNTVYMTAYFTGGALGSALGTLAWGRWGWTGVCGAGLGLLAAAMAVHLTTGGARSSVSAE